MAYASLTTYLLTNLPNDYIIIMEGKKNFFIWNGLIVDRLIGPKLMSFWSVWG